MKLYLKKVTGMLTILLLFMAMACSEDDKGTNPGEDDNNNPITFKHKLSAKFSGAYNANFSPILTIGVIGSGEVQMVGNSGKEFLYLFFEADLAIGTHDEFNAHLITVIESVRNEYKFDAGTIHIKTNNNNVIEGTFSMSLSHITTGLPVNVTNGYFTYAK